MDADPLATLTKRTRCFSKDLEAKSHNAPGSNWRKASTTSSGKTLNSPHDSSQGGLVTSLRLLRKDGTGVSQRKLDLRRDIPRLVSRVRISALTRGLKAHGHCSVR